MFLSPVAIAQTAKGEQKAVFFGLEGKIGFGGEKGSNPFGFGGNFHMNIGPEKMFLAADAGLQIVSNWEDTLDLHDSPDTMDAHIYDIWIRRGTDVALFIGPDIEYNVIESGKMTVRAQLGSGMLANISSYDDIKRQEPGSAKNEKSEINTDIGLYIKPRVLLKINNIYFAYEYFALADFLEHNFCLGIEF